MKLLTNSRVRAVVFLLLILLGQFVLRLPYFTEPLERDEGIFGYMAQTLIRGGDIYKDAFDNKPPVVYFIYSFMFKTFGESIFSIRLFTYFYSCITTILIFAIGYLLFGAEGGLLGALFYAIFSGGPFIHGTSADTETFMVLFLAAAYLCFILGERNKKHLYFILAGFFSSLAVMTKQMGIFNFIIFLIFCFDYQLNKVRINLKNFFSLIFGFLLFLIILAFYFIYRGTLLDFVDCVFIVNFKYFGRLFFINNRFLNLPYVMNYENSILWIMALSGLLFILTKERKKDILLLVGWGIASFLGVCYSGHYFGHYFIQVIPALSILSSYAFLKWTKESILQTSNIIAIPAFAILIFLIFLNQYPFYFKYSPYQISQVKYQTNIFSWALLAGEDIKKETDPKDYVLSYGMEGEINFYSNRKSPSKYFYITGMYKPEFIALEKAQILKDVLKIKPKIIVLSLAFRPFKELEDYTYRNYRLLGKYGNEIRVYKRT